MPADLRLAFTPSRKLSEALNFETPFPPCHGRPQGFCFAGGHPTGGSIVGGKSLPQCPTNRSTKLIRIPTKVRRTKGLSRRKGNRAFFFE